MSNVISMTSNDFSEMSTGSIMPFNILANAYGETIAAEQLSLEHEAYTLGEARFKKALERQIERGEVCDNQVARPLMDTLLPVLSKAIGEFLESKGRGRPHVSKQYLSQIDSMNAAFITVKTILSILAKEESAPIQRVAMAIGGNLQDEVQYGRIRDEEAKHFKDRVEDALDKRQGYVFKKAYMQAVEIGMLEQGQLSSTANFITQHRREVLKARACTIKGQRKA